MEDKEHSEYLVKLQINSWKEEILQHNTQVIPSTQCINGAYII